MFLLTRRRRQWSLFVAVVFAVLVHDDVAFAAVPVWFCRNSKKKNIVAKSRSSRSSSGDESATTSSASADDDASTPSASSSDDSSTTTGTITATTTATANSHSRPERGKVLPNPANERDLYDAYVDIQSDYESKAFHSADWKVLNSNNDVQVSILQHPDDPTCPYVKMQGIIPVPVGACWDFLRIEDWDRNMPKMDPFYEGVTVYGEYSITVPTTITKSTASWRRKKNNQQHNDGGSDNTVRMILCRKRMSRILAFGKRDLVFLSVAESEPLEDGSLVSGTVSVRTPLVPRQPGYTRAFQDSIAFYKPIKGGTETYVDSSLLRTYGIA